MIIRLVINVTGKKLHARVDASQSGSVSTVREKRSVVALKTINLEEVWQAPRWVWVFKLDPINFSLVISRIEGTDCKLGLVGVKTHANDWVEELAGLP